MSNNGRDESLADHRRGGHESSDGFCDLFRGAARANQRDDPPQILGGVGFASKASFAPKIRLLPQKSPFSRRDPFEAHESDNARGQRDPVPTPSELFRRFRFDNHRHGEASEKGRRHDD
jgi:hypothetical protein